MNAIETKALTIAAHNRLALEDRPADALAAYLQLKELVANGEGDMPMLNVDDSAHAGEDDDVLVSDMVSDIEHHAQVLIEFGKELLRAAHTGLINAAIDGTLDSDANTWDLNGHAQANLDMVEV